MPRATSPSASTAPQPPQPSPATSTPRPTTTICVATISGWRVTTGMPANTTSRPCRSSPIMPSAGRASAEYYSVRALDGDVDPLQALPQAEDAARKAVKLDPSLPQAHTVLGAAIFFNRLDWSQALNEVTRATELDPRYSEAYHLHAKILCALGRNSEAIAVQKLSTAANPYAHPGAMAEIYLCIRDYDASIADARMRLKDFPESADLLFDLAESYHWKHMDKEATEMTARELSAEGDPHLAAAVRAAFQSGGFTAVVRCQLADLEKKARAGRVSTFRLCPVSRVAWRARQNPRLARSVRPRTRSTVAFFGPAGCRLRLPPRRPALSRPRPAAGSSSN